MEELGRMLPLRVNNYVGGILLDTCQSLGGEKIEVQHYPQCCLHDIPPPRHQGQLGGTAPGAPSARSILGMHFAIHFQVRWDATV